MTFALNQLAVISDLTGTLVRQTHDGFPPERRKVIRELVDGGALFIVITNDSFAAVKEHFSDPLGTTASPYFVVSAGGYEGWKLEGGETSSLFVAREISLSARQDLIANLGEILNDSLGCGDVLAPEQDAFLSKQGKRLQITSLHAEFGPLSFVEVLPAKVAIFFLDHPVAGVIEQDLFAALESSREVQRILRDENLYFTRGANYVDITSCVKREGIEHLLAHSELKSYALDSRDILVLGDSPNDEGILAYPYLTTGKVRRVFLGEDQEFLSKIQNQYPSETHFLPGEYTQGGARVLLQLLG